MMKQTCLILNRKPAIRAILEERERCFLGKGQYNIIWWKRSVY